MSFARSARAVVLCAASAVLASALALCFEAARRAPDRSWFRLSAGLGIGSRSGVGDGYFAFDARLEALPEALFEPLPGSAIGAGNADGAFTCLPPER